MHETYIVLHENPERSQLVDAYNKNPELIYAIYYKWCWLTFNSNPIQKKYGLSTKPFESRTTSSTQFGLNYSYEFKPENIEEDKQVQFEHDLFHKLLRPLDSDNEEENYYKGLLREHLGVNYDATGKLVNSRWKSTRTIDNNTGISYVTVSKDLKEGIKYIYKEWEK